MYGATVPKMQDVIPTIVHKKSEIQNIWLQIRDGTYHALHVTLSDPLLPDTYPVNTRRRSYPKRQEPSYIITRTALTGAGFFEF